MLREYRTRLIADVVTGKLDVREAAVQLLAEETPLVEGDFSSDSEMPDDEVMAGSMPRIHSPKSVESPLNPVRRIMRVAGRSTLDRKEMVNGQPLS